MSDTDDDDCDLDILLLAPLRMATCEKLHSPKKDITRKIFSRISSSSPCNIESKSVLSKSSDVQGVVEKSVAQTLNESLLTDVLLKDKCTPLLSMLNTRSLLNFARASSSIRKYLLQLKFKLKISFHDLASIIGVGCDFGVLAGCLLEVGTDDEKVQCSDVVAVTRMLQNPKMQLSVKIVAFNACITPEVGDIRVVEFLRSFRFPSLFSLESVNLEGSLIGPKGLKNFCSVLRGKRLPNLRLLNLSRNYAQDVGINCLYQALCTEDVCPLLETLMLAGNRAEQSMIDILCGSFVRSRSSLTHIDISDNNTCLSDGKSCVMLKSCTPQLNSLCTLDLSFNPLEDEGAFTLLSCAWQSGVPVNTSCLRHLHLVNCNIGNKTFAYLGHLLGVKQFQHLETLSLGMNNGQGGEAISYILNPLCPVNEIQGDTLSSQTTIPVPSLRHLLVPFNNFNDEGLAVILGAALKGCFIKLETLDVSDIGASPQALNSFVHAFTSHTQYQNLKKLVVIGRHPFAQRVIRSSNIPQSFLRRVKVS